MLTTNVIYTKCIFWHIITVGELVGAGVGESVGDGVGLIVGLFVGAGVGDAYIYILIKYVNYL